MNAHPSSDNDQPPDNGDNRRRDVATLRVLGIFFSVMGALVLVATYETLGNRPAFVANVASGLVLAAVGAGMIQVSRRFSR